jgi:hypothetical protein
VSDIDTAVVDGLKRLTLNGRLEKRTLPCASECPLYTLERLIGIVRRECLDRMLVFGAAHLFFPLMQCTTMSPHAPGIGQGCAPGSGGPALQCHYRHPNLVRAASPLRPDMIFGKDRVLV